MSYKSAGPMLRRVQLLSLATPPAPPAIASAEYERRLEDLRDRARQGGCDAVVVYADREHFANMLFLSGYDPRFEEALLVLAEDEVPRLLVGNEGIGHSQVAKIEVERLLAQSLSLLGQDRSRAPCLKDVLREAGIRSGATIGLVGWKSFLREEADGAGAYFACPQFVVEAIRAALGTDGSIRDVTPLLLDPVSGLRSRHTPAAVAELEYGAALASQHVLRLLEAFEPGMTELEAAEAMRLNGYPLSCHPMVIAGRDDLVGLRSPSGREIRRGDAMIVAVGLWGGLSARAGIVAEDEAEGGPELGGYVDGFCGPYFRAIKRWYETVRVGVSGGEVVAAVDEELESAPFRLLLNPGHLTHHDEWTHSPMRPGAADRLASGTMLQCDLIPVGTSPFETCGVEDTVCIADEEFREQLFSSYPELAERVAARRRFLEDEIGIVPSADLLPFSDIPGYFPALMLRRSTSLSFASATAAAGSTASG